MAFSVAAVSRSVSPLRMAEDAIDMFMTSAPRRLPASSKLDWVRVEDSKNRLIWVRPRSVVRFFSEARNRDEVERLRRHGVRWPAAAARPPRGGALAGKSFVLTGTLEGMSREEAGERIRAAGGRVTSSVSKKTDYVVAGSDPGTKLRRAQELGIEILDRKGLESLLGGSPDDGREKAPSA